MYALLIAWCCLHVIHMIIGVMKQLNKTLTNSQNGCFSALFMSTKRKFIYFWQFVLKGGWRRISLDSELNKLHCCVQITYVFVYTMFDYTNTIHKIFVLFFHPFMHSNHRNSISFEEMKSQKFLFFMFCVHCSLFTRWFKVRT